MKINNYMKPPVISYLHHAIPLGIILTNKNANEWFISNYIYLYFDKIVQRLNFLVEYDNNPYLKTNKISKTEFDNILKIRSLEDYIISYLDDNSYVEIVVDEYYLPLTVSYKKKHFMHEILITGYNYQKKEFHFWEFIKYKYTEYRCSFQDIVPFDSEIFYGDDTIMKIYTGKKSDFILNTDIIRHELIDYYESNNPYNNIAIWGDYDKYKNHIFGFRCYDEIIKYIRGCLLEGYIDYRCINVFYEHKKCMRIRLENLLSYNSDNKLYISEEVISDAKLIEKKANIILNIALKFNSLENNKSLEKYHSLEKNREEIIEKIIKSILEIKEKEEILLKVIIK